MTRNIRDFAYSIGYIDAGHGHSENLVEIELKNKDGNFLSSRQAMSKGGIADAAKDVPTDLSSNFDGVNYLNKPGPNTWPIVAMSYIYVRKDISSIVENKDSQALLKAFLLSLYDDEYISECSEYGFSPAPTNVAETAKAAINSLEVNDDAPTFIFEGDSTQRFFGQGPYVISNKIRRYSDVNRGSQGADIKELKEKTNKAETDIKALDSAILKMSGAPTPAAVKSGRTFTDTDYKNLMAALVLGSISFCLWVLIFFIFAMKRLCGL